MRRRYRCPEAAAFHARARGAARAGVPRERLLLEEWATNTRESARRCSELLRDDDGVGDGNSDGDNNRGGDDEDGDDTNNYDGDGNDGQSLTRAKTTTPWTVYKPDLLLTYND